LSVDITSSGWLFPGGPVEALFTVNNLVGAGTGPFILSASSNRDADPLVRRQRCRRPDRVGRVQRRRCALRSHFAASRCASADATIEIVGVPASEPMALR
jgi:hypothetical protein